MYAQQPPPPFGAHMAAPPQLVLLRFDHASMTTERTEVASLCAQFGEVAYVDFRFGECIGFVRFRRPEAARAAIDALTMYPQQICGVVPTWRLLGIEETRDYWAATKSGKSAAAQGGGGPGGAMVGQPAALGGAPGGAPGGSTIGGHSAPRSDRGATPRAMEARPAERGLVLAFEGAEPNTDRADLTAVCNHYGPVAYVDFRFGSTAGYVRFRTADGARAALGALSSGTISIGGAIPAWRLVPEEEEEQYKLAVQNKKRLRLEEQQQQAAAAAAQAQQHAAQQHAAQHQAHMQQQHHHHHHLAGGGGAPPPHAMHQMPPPPYGMAAGLGGMGGVLAGGGAFASGHALEPSAVLRFEQASGEASRESVAEACGAHAEVAFVDFRPGTTAGYVRFRTADGARAALGALSVGADGVLVPSTWRQLSIAEANAYREEVQNARRARQFDLGAAKGGGWAGGKGGWMGAPGRMAARGWGGGIGRGRGRIAW
jgi:hypothetical protein